MAALASLGALGVFGVFGTRVTAAAGASTPVAVVYVSLPLQGSSVADTDPLVNGIKLALAQHHGVAGSTQVDLTVLDDSTARAGEWTPQQTASNARRAAGDTRAVLYIGDFNSGASIVSMPILNQAGLAQLSPSNTYPGLTIRAPGTQPGEPQKYAPTGHRTYMRLMPPDPVQALALLNAMRTDRCRRVMVVNDGEAYGFGLATELQNQAHGAGVDVVNDTSVAPLPANQAGIAAAATKINPDCFLYAGIDANGGVGMLKAVGSALPHARLFGGDGMCTTTVTNAHQGGVPASVAARFQCTALPMPITAYPGGRAFLAAYHAMFGAATPDGYALYGYESMELALDTITKLGAQGTNRAAVLKAMLATHGRRSVLGTYSFNATGDTTLRSYGLFGGTSGGQLRFLRNAFA